jgi:hypothetical protein
MSLDALVRCRLEVLVRKVHDLGNPAFVSLRAGARSLTIEFDPALATQHDIINIFQDADDSIPDVTSVKIPARKIRLPVVFDEAALREANQRYGCNRRPALRLCFRSHIGSLFLDTWRRLETKRPTCPIHSSLWRVPTASPTDERPRRPSSATTSWFPLASSAARRLPSHWTLANVSIFALGASLSEDS